MSETNSELCNLVSASKLVSMIFRGKLISGVIFLNLQASFIIFFPKKNMFFYTILVIKIPFIALFKIAAIVDDKNSKGETSLWEHNDSKNAAL